MCRSKAGALAKGSASDLFSEGNFPTYRIEVQKLCILLCVHKNRFWSEEDEEWFELLWGDFSPHKTKFTNALVRSHRSQID